MKKVLLLLLSCTLFISGCNTTTNTDTIEKWKVEIGQAEKDFDAMAQKEGLIKAFHFYAAEDGVIRRGKKVIQGKAAIMDWYKEDVRPNETLSWKPTFIDVSASGDLGYTYGDYVFTSIDSLGNKKENKGIFHTVWKRQKDGSWKFVWD